MGRHTGQKGRGIPTANWNGNQVFKSTSVLILGSYHLTTIMDSSATKENDRKRSSNCRSGLEQSVVR